MLMIAFLRFAQVYRHSKKKWSTIIANRQVKINKKMLYVLVFKYTDKMGVVLTVIPGNDLLISIFCQF